jgi:hypothetical protein
MKFILSCLLISTAYLGARTGLDFDDVKLAEAHRQKTLQNLHVAQAPLHTKQEKATEAEIINVIRSRRHRGIVYKFTKALGYSFSKTLPSIMFHVRKPTVIRFPKKISIELDVIVSPRSNRVSFILHVDENNGTTAYLLFTLLAFVLS